MPPAIDLTQAVVAQFANRPLMEVARQVEDGVPASRLRDLLAGGVVTLADLDGVVAPRRTLERRLQSGQPLTRDEGDRFVRLANLLDLTTHIWGSTGKAMEWLRAPKHRFDEASPLQMARTEAGARLVTEVLEQSRHGITA